MWYLLHAQEDDSLCIVQEKNLMKAGSVIHVNEVSKFYYNGKEYTGPVLFKSPDHAEVVAALNHKRKELRHKKQANETTAVDDNQSGSGKRKSQPPNFYGNKASSSEPPSKKMKNNKPKVSEEEKTRLRILSLNKKNATKYSNANLLDTLKSKKSNVEEHQDEDSDYHPDDDGVSISSNSSDDETLAQKLDHSKEERSNLLKDLRDLSRSPKSKAPAAPHPLPGKGASKVAATQEPSSPSTQELLKEIKLLKLQLQAAKEKEQNAGSSSDVNKDGHGSNHTFNLDNELGADGNDNEDQAAGGNDIDDEKEDSGNSHDRTTSSVNNEENHENSDLDAINLDEFSTEGLNEQLYGHRQDTKLLTKKIYCKISVLTKALASATNVNSLVRKLMHGVFIPSKILNCTVSGQSWRAGGEEKAAETKSPLHPVALQAIINFANAVAASKGWGGSAKKLSRMKPVVARRLIEIKNQYRQGKLQD